MSVVASGSGFSYQWYIRRHRERGQSYRWATSRQLHDAGLDQHDELLGASIEFGRQRGLEHCHDHG